MKRFILYTFLAFTLLSCGGSEGRFRLKGEFEHLQQGEFYIYSDDGGTSRLDTIKVERGSFDYETALDNTATYYLLYPNLSEQVIFGASGEVITIKGDARNLKSVEVKGSEPNEDLTAFRLANKDKRKTDMQKAAAEFIRQHPSSPVSVFLFKEYFLSSDDASQEEVKKHYRALCKAQPDNLQLLQWKADVESRGRRLVKGSSLPKIEWVGEDGKSVTSEDYRGKNLLINFWASWDSESSGLMFRLRRLLKEHPGKIHVVSISLDVEAAPRKGIERMDSVTWPSYCDYQAWNSPMVRQFAVSSVPYCILAGSDGKVVAVGSSYEKDIQPEIQKLIDSK
ncbi:MAG: AhpC/TSA family protein [Paraprevotella sp.]|nr:AhpC/TSA family protein [Paraprevotella sp.]